MGKRANADLSLTFIGSRLDSIATQVGHHEAYLDASKAIWATAEKYFRAGKIKRAVALRNEAIELERVADDIRARCQAGGYWAQREELLNELAYRDGEHAANEDGIKQALNVIERYGGIGGDHHKAWVIDRVVRALLGSGYAVWVKEVCGTEYTWDEGIPP